jgi:hypothetical protein
MPRVAIALAVCILPWATGCASLMVVMGDAFTAQATNLKYGYFPATRMDLFAIRSVWRDEEAILPGKVIGTGFISLDMPLSLTFDLLVAAPVNYLHGNPPPPWKEVPEVRCGQVSIRPGMDKEEVRSQLSRVGMPPPLVWEGDLWQARFPVSVAPSFYYGVWAAPMELHFREGKVASIFEDKDAAKWLELPAAPGHGQASGS